MNKTYFKNTEDSQDITEIEKEFITQINNDHDFVNEVIKPLNISNDVFKDYLGLFIDAQKEFHHCKECPGLNKCQNSCPGLRLFIKKEMNFVAKNFIPCPLFVQKKSIDDHYIYRDFDEKYDDVFLEDLKIYKDGFRQQLKLALKQSLKEKDQGWFYVYGEKNSSKTQFLAAYCNSYAKNKYGHIAFLDAKELLELVKDTFYKNNEYFQDLLDTLKNVKLLVLDGFNSDAVMNTIIRDQFILPLFSYRDEHKLQTCISSNCNLDDFNNYLAISKFGAGNALKISNIIYKNKYKKLYKLTRLVI